MDNKILNRSSIVSIKDLSYNFNKEKRQLTHYISTETTNVYGYILRNFGMNQDEYRLNPMVLWQHELDGGFFMNTPKPKDIIPAKNISLNPDNKGIEAVTEFNDTELGEDVMQQNIKGFLNAWSVRWDILTSEENDISFVGETPMVINWKMKEYSSCIMPGNPTATNRLQQALSEVKSPAMKMYLSNKILVTQFQEDINKKQLEFESKIDAKLSETETSKKQLDDLKNELKAELGRFKKYTTDKLMILAHDNLTVKENLLSFIKTSISQQIDGSCERIIRKYIGKVD